MGYGVELFLDAVDESLKCDLCNGVFREPVATRCGHIYCVGCLRRWLRAQDACPRECQQIRSEKELTLLLPLQKLVDRLRIRCVHHVKGCSVVLAVQDMIEHTEQCEYATGEEETVASTTDDRSVGKQPEVNGFSQVLVCRNGCGLPLLGQDSSAHDCVKSLQAQVSSLQTKLTRSEHDKDKISQRLVRREECMQERFTLLERELRAYQEQTLNYERVTRDQRCQVRYLQRQLDNPNRDQTNEASELEILLERDNGTLGFNIRGGTEEEDGQCGIYVSKILENSPASQPGKLQLFDRIIQINEVDLRNATHQEAVQAFKNSGDSLNITVKRSFNAREEMLASPELVSTAVQTEPSDVPATQLTCCRCNGSNRSSQEFSSQGGINLIHQREDSGVDETGEHPSDVELQNGCPNVEILDGDGGQNKVYPSTITKCDDILNKLLLNSSLAALDRRTSRALLADLTQRGYEIEDNSELRSLSNGYYSGNVSQASLENVRQGAIHERLYDYNRNVDEGSNVDDLNNENNAAQGTDQLYFDSELEYEYEEITISVRGRRSLGMKLFSGDGEDANSVFINEVDPNSVVGKDGRVIEGDQILKINDVAVVGLSDAVDLLSERRDEIKFLVARPVAELQATLLGHESDRECAGLDHASRFHLEAFPIGVIEEEDEDEAETVIGDRCEKDSGFGRTDDSLKNEESSEHDGNEDHRQGTTQDQHKADMDALGQQIIHFTACASTARELSVRDSPREKSSDEHSQRSGEREKRENKSTKHHSSRRASQKTSSDENTHSSGHERKTGSKPQTNGKNTKPKSSDSPSRSKERSESRESGQRSEQKRKKDKSSKEGAVNGSRTAKESQGKAASGQETENGEMKTEWRVRRNKDGSRIFISKKMRPAKQKLLRERAQKLAEERRGLTTDDETQSVYLGRYWSREDRRRQLDKVRHARRSKKDEIDADRKVSGHNSKRNDFAIIELTQKKMACVEQTFDDFITVDEILRQRNRIGLTSGPVFVTTV